MSELRFECIRMQGADLGPESCVPDLLGEHILQNHLEFRLDEEDEIYEGYGRRKNAYPYRAVQQLYQKAERKRDFHGNTGKSVFKSGISAGIRRKTLGTVG